MAMDGKNSSQLSNRERKIMEFAAADVSIVCGVAIAVGVNRPLVMQMRNSLARGAVTLVLLGRLPPLTYLRHWRTWAQRV